MTQDRWIEVAVGLGLGIIFIALVVGLDLYFHRNQIRKFGFRRSYLLDLLLCVAMIIVYFALVRYFFPASHFLQNTAVVPVLLLGGIIRYFYPAYFKSWQER